MYKGELKQIPCKIVCLADANTSSSDLGSLRHRTCCDLVMQKSIHGSWLYALANTFRDFQMAQIIISWNACNVNAENAETRNPVGSSGAGIPAMVAIAESSYKSLAGMHVMLV